MMCLLFSTRQTTLNLPPPLFLSVHHATYNIYGRFSSVGFKQFTYTSKIMGVPSKSITQQQCYRAFHAYRYFVLTGGFTVYYGFFNALPLV